MHTIPMVASGFVGRPGGIGSSLDWDVRWRYTAAPPSKNTRPTTIRPTASVARAFLLDKIAPTPDGGQNSFANSLRGKMLCGPAAFQRADGAPRRESEYEQQAEAKAQTGVRLPHRHRLDKEHRRGYKERSET